MTEDTAGKEWNLTSQNTAIARKRSKPELVVVGKRMMCTDGRVHPDLMADYITSNADEKWLTTGELSRVFVGANTTDGKKRVRRQMFSVFTRLLARGEFLVYETDASSGRIHAVKLLNITSEPERQAAERQLKRMRDRQQLSVQKFEQAMQVIEIKERMSA